jgi:hypothetical protein
MTQMTKVQAEALTALITRLRPEWRPVGVMAALEKCAPTADAFDVCRALVNLAQDPTVLTPGLLDKPGPHWRKPSGDMPGRRGDHDVRCGEHPNQILPRCTECEEEKAGKGPTPDYLEAKEKYVRSSRPRHDLTPPTRDPVAAQRLDEDERETARQQLEPQEANR